MTRDERAALREQRLKDHIATMQRQLARVEAQQREAARKDRTKRRFQVGALAEAAGLCAWDDATLSGLFQVLARLEGTPDPVKVLDGLVGEGAHEPSATLDEMLRAVENWHVFGADSGGGG